MSSILNALKKVEADGAAEDPRGPQAPHQMKALLSPRPGSRWYSGGGSCMSWRPFFLQPAPPPIITIGLAPAVRPRRRESHRKCDPGCLPTNSAAARSAAGQTGACTPGRICPKAARKTGGPAPRRLKAKRHRRFKRLPPPAASARRKAADRRLKHGRRRLQRAQRPKTVPAPAGRPPADPPRIA